MESRSRFEDLPARPPTPPKESGVPSDGPEPELPAKHSFQPRPALDTPNESPCSVLTAGEEAASSLSSERPSTKRVDFQIGASKLATMETSSPHGSQPSSRETRPVKSILKPSTTALDRTREAVPEQRDFPRILDDFARQLAAPSASSRLDAYTQLNNCLKTYKNMPEQQALREKMPLLTSFIERDLQETQVGEDARGTQLATEVVRLVTTLLWSPTMGDVLPDAFQCFILDKSIAVAGSAGIPKALVNQYLHLLSVQSFRSKFMNVDRVNRIITNLSKIAEHVKGKQVTAHKLEIYKKLIGQARSVMHSRFLDWYEGLFHGLLASHQEIRVRALSLAYEAGVAFGASEQVTKAVVNLFNHRVESQDSQQRYGDLFTSRLQEQLGSKEDRQQVPQIWAAVLLFMRHKSRPVERWAFTTKWLHLMKQCLNIGYADLRLQAMRAWSRWIYVVDPTLSTNESMALLLRTPVEKQLLRFKDPERETKKLRSSVIATYATLLYYALRPNVSHDTIDRFWCLYVDHFLKGSPEQPPLLDATNGSAILVSLIGDDRQKVWNASRGIESALIKVDELVRLDPKWIRARASTVLATLEQAMLNEEWWSGDVEQTPALRVWRAFTKALGEASRKEVIVSSETMQAVAELISALIRFFIQTTIRTVPSRTLYKRLGALVEAAVLNMGHLPFAEQRLIRAAPEKYAVIAAPAGRAQKSGHAQITAFGGLIDAVLSSVGDDSIAPEAVTLLELLVQNSLKAGSSLGSRLNILRATCSRLSSTQEEPHPTPAKMQLWKICASSLKADLDQTGSGKLRDDSTVQGHDLRNMTKILEAGMKLALTPSEMWMQLLDAIQTYVCREAGFTVWTTVVLKPLMESMMPRSAQDLEDTLPGILHLLQNTLPNTPFTNDTPRKDASKALGITPKQRSELHHAPLILASRSLSILYSAPKRFDLGIQAQLLDVTGSLLKAVPKVSFVSSIVAAEIGLAAWVQDVDGLLNTESFQNISVFRSLVGAWEVVATGVNELKTPEQSTLNPLTLILVAGLGSRHRAVGNRAIEVWNSTFGRYSDLDYPLALEKVLLRLDAIADISAPCLRLDKVVVGVGAASESLADHASSFEPASSYLPTPANLSELDADNDEENHWDPAFYTKQPRRPLASIGANNSPMATPERPKREHRPSSTPRLRHDDSQIQFAAITSSPPNIEALESQLLTEHQREVRDRQQAEASAMFPDLRSSPRPRYPDRDVPRLRLRSDETLPRSDPEDPHSPTLPPPSETPFLGSSPTPSQRLSGKERASSRASVESQFAALDDVSADRERRARPVSSSAKSDFSSEMQTFGEELLALYEEPVDEIVVFPPSSEQLSSEADSKYVDASSYLPDAEPDRGSLSPHLLSAKLAEVAELEQEAVEPEGEEDDPPKEAEDDDDRIAAQLLQDIDQAQSMSQNQTGSSSMQELPSSQYSLRGKRRREEPTQSPQGEKRARTPSQKTGIRPVKAASADDLEDCIVVACSRPRPSQQKPAGPDVDMDPPTRRPVKSSSVDAASSCLSSEAVFDVPPTPEVRRRVPPRKRSSPAPMSLVQPPAKRVRSPEVTVAREPSAELTSSPPRAALAARDPVPAAMEPVEAAVEEEAKTVDGAASISGEEFLARVRQLVEDAQHVVLGACGDEIMAGLLEVGREVMDAKRRD